MKLRIFNVPGEKDIAITIPTFLFCNRLGAFVAARKYNNFVNEKLETTKSLKEDLLNDERLGKAEDNLEARLTKASDYEEIDNLLDKVKAKDLDRKALIKELQALEERLQKINFAKTYSFLKNACKFIRKFKRKHKDFKFLEIKSKDGEYIYLSL